MAIAKNKKVAEVKPTPDINQLSAALMGKSKETPVAPPAVVKTVVSKCNWSGVLKFAAVTLSIKTYKATEPDEIKFNQVHDCNAIVATDTPEQIKEKKTKEGSLFTQLKQSGMQCPTCVRPVSSDEIQKAFKVAEGQFVIISDDEKKSQMAASDKQMEITEFVSANSVDPIYFEAADYVVPEKGFEKIFALLRAGMIAKGVVAVASCAMRGREQTLILRPFGEDGMTAHFMYFENEIRECNKWVPVQVNEQEKEIAGMLIDAFTDEFNPSEKFDSYFVNLRKLIASKQVGEAAPVIERKQAASPTTDLMAALKASLESPVIAARKAKRAAAGAKRK